MTAEASDDTSLVGRVIQGRFRILERLAAGGMGAVYLAEQMPLGRKVALKVLEPAAGNVGAKIQFEERFLLEAAAVAKLSHPNTIVLYDYGRTTDGRYYYAMELVEGMTLTKLIREHRALDSGLAVHVAAQICGSLREAHEAGLVHRDLKPSNVMLTRRGDDPHYVKVLDFGLVKVVGDDATANLTRSGIVLGSPRYMAPEQIETRSVDYRADIYAFGAVLYHMLAGEPPFVYPSQFETLRAQVDEPPPPLEAKNPYCEAGPELRGLVFQCLDKRPEARPQTMADVAVRLRSCAMEVGISIPSISGVDIGLLAARAEARVPPPLEERVSAPPATMAAKPSARSKQESPEPEARPTVPDSPPAPEPPATPERRRSWLIPAILVALVGIGVAAAAFVIPMGGSEEPAAESTPTPAIEPPPAPEPAPAATTVQLDSEPSGARVHHGDVDLGDAPVGLPIPAGERWELTLSLPGYEPRTIMVAAGQPSAHVRLTPQAAPQPEPDTPRRGQRHRPQGDSDEHNDLRNPWGQ